ncbi:hypothetical protein GCM10010324_53290 [Streptomyces hiroshimensis]|uniref:Uncharacterized protein n=1 Tax=Streptomyces hiroshimensis TaxID=66424 RepID=A0ABQ2Z1S0_9ACTN|nr:hypothetical protein GCM10010324_53290 [Streptomyces hiroshimensis]
MPAPAPAGFDSLTLPPPGSLPRAAGEGGPRRGSSAILSLRPLQPKAAMLPTSARHTRRSRRSRRTGHVIEHPQIFGIVFLVGRATARKTKHPVRVAEWQTR